MRVAIQGPTFAELASEQCYEILERNHVGRLAFALPSIDIQPIHYAYAGGRLVFRTAPGTKLTALVHRPWVALEVDEIDGTFDWRSVVIHGTVYALSETGIPEERNARREAIDVLRRVVPGTLTSADPTPARDVIMGLAIDRITGRSAVDLRR
jgi:nitroimidazol reductase NimA-like FMN-containing flavoprotein (pyridoxamine 5'-phosphate oxidase superfamily)